MDSGPHMPVVEVGEQPKQPAIASADTLMSDLRSYLQTIIGAVILSILFMTFVARGFTVDGPSMQPTLYGGERLIVDKISYRLHPPRPGDVVVFHLPADPGRYYVKRIIGRPGDKVEISAGAVYVNGARWNEEYSTGPINGKFGPYIVPAGHYFVLGDNRNNSEDSRSVRVGFVPDKMIVGRVVWRYWPISRAGSLAGAEFSLVHAGGEM